VFEGEKEWVKSGSGGGLFLFFFIFTVVPLASEKCL
jgi:hypothetical protein